MFTQHRYGLARLLLLFVAGSFLFNAVCGSKALVIVGESVSFDLLEEVNEDESEKSFDSLCVVTHATELPALDSVFSTEIESDQRDGGHGLDEAHLWRGPPVRNALSLRS